MKICGIKKRKVLEVVAPGFEIPSEEEDRCTMESEGQPYDVHYKEKGLLRAEEGSMEVVTIAIYSNTFYAVFVLQ